MVAGKRYTRVTTGQVDGFQHARDDYWFRPVVFGMKSAAEMDALLPGGPVSR